MAVRRINPDLAYGIGDALIPLAPLPIIAKRDPTANDLAQLGTTWVNEATGAVWILARIIANASDWVTSPVIGGAGVFTSLDVTSGSLTVDLGAGGIDVGGGNFTVDNAGDVVIGGNLSVAGTFTFSGTLNLTSAALISIESTFNGAPSILLEANGGANEQILLHSLQGTSVSAVEVLADLGGVLIEGGLNTINAVKLQSSNAAGGVNVAAGTAGITLAAANGAVGITSGTGAINIGADAVAHTVTIGNNTGASVVAINAGTAAAGAINIGTSANAVPITIGNSTGTTALLLNAGTSGVGVGSNAIAHTVTIGNNTGASVVAINGGTGAAGAINIGTTANDVPITLGNSTGATAILLNAGTGGVGVGTNAIAHTVTLGNNTGVSSVVANVGTGAASFGANATDHSTNVGSATGVAATTIQGGTAGITLTAPFVALPGPVYIYTGAGAPAGALSLHVGDLYINTTAATLATRMYIADTVGTWTNFVCAA